MSALHKVQREFDKEKTALGESGEMRGETRLRDHVGRFGFAFDGSRDVGFDRGIAREPVFHVIRQVFHDVIAERGVVAVLFLVQANARVGQELDAVQELAAYGAYDLQPRRELGQVPHQEAGYGVAAVGFVVLCFADGVDQDHLWTNL